MSETEQTAVIDRLRVVRHASRQSLGIAAGDEIASILRQRLAEQPQVRVVFAAAPSQNETLERLCAADGIDWPRVVAFHMDEYVGLAADAPQRFSRYLCEHLFDRVSPGQVQLIGREHPLATLADAAGECERYASLLAEGPTFDLFRGDVVGGALNTGFYGSQGAALAQVDDADGAVFGDDNVVWFDVAVKKSGTVHTIKPIGNHPENKQKVQKTTAGTLLKTDSGAVFHQQHDLPGLHMTFFAADFVNLANIRMVDLFTHLVFVFDLFDHSLIFAFLANDMLERIDFVGFSVFDLKNDAGCADSHPSDGLIAVKGR